jgi:hypothetical protein
MIASREMTDGQIENVCDKLRAALRKHRAEISSEAAQAAIGVENIGMIMFTSFRQQAEKFSEMIVRRVKVDRSRTPQQALDATDRRQYTDSEVVAQMPRCEGEEVDVYFFSLKEHRDVKDIDEMFEERGLKPDPYAVAAVNEIDPAFSDSHPNGTQWKDNQGRHCFVTFFRWLDERRLHCRRFRLEHDWDDCWWLGGVRQRVVVPKLA